MIKKILPHRMFLFFNEENSNKVVIVLLAFTIGLRLLFLFTIKNELRWYDEHNYHSIAISIKNGNGFVSTYNPYSTTHWAPLQGYYLAGIYAIFGSHPLAARAVEDVLSGFIMLLIYFLGRKYFSYHVALIASAIFAIHPIFIYVSNTLYPTVIFTLISMLSFLFFEQSISKKSYAKFVAASALLGLAMLAKPVAIFFVPAITVSIWLKFKFSKNFWLGILILLFVVGLVLSPWIIYNHQKYGKWFFITQEGAYSFVAANNPHFELKERGQISVPDELKQKVRQLDEEQRNKVYFREAFEFITGQPLKFAKNYFLRFLSFWRFYPNTISKNVDTNKRNIVVSAIFYFALLPLSFIGMYLTRTRWNQLNLLYLFVVFFAAGYAFFVPSIRYRLPIEPYLILFAAVAIFSLFDKFRSNLGNSIL